MKVKKPVHINEQRWKTNQQWVNLTNEESTRQQRQRPARLYRKTKVENLITTRP